jgi:acylphosphatase
MSEEDQTQAHVFIAGRVQGVNYRYYTRQRAVELNLRGWVRNMMDGRVEAVFQGDQIQVEKILKWCEHGPPSARVTDVEVKWQKPSETFSNFDIKFW